MTPGTCAYSEDDVLAYVAGEGSPEGLVEMARHLALCGACREEAVMFRGLAAELDTVGAEEALYWSTFDSPFGVMAVAATERGLAWVSWRHPDEDTLVSRLEDRFSGSPVVHDPVRMKAWSTQLREYFRGSRTSFDLPVDLRTLSDFERSVLEAARQIPYGEVIPYAELARRIRKPRAARAVGNALGHNPVAIVVPCHRVVRSDGSLGGYTGGEEYKRKLLAIEGRLDLLLAG